MERLIQRLRASISRGKQRKMRTRARKEGEKRECHARERERKGFVDYGFTWASEGKRRRREERRGEKSQRDGVAYASSRFPLCSREVERRQKEKKAGEGEMLGVARASLTRREKHSLRRGGKKKRKSPVSETRVRQVFPQNNGGGTTATRI